MAALTEVGVAELADRFPERLSGGQRQRVAIARGLVGNRSVILADEPTGALDSHTGEQIMLVLRNHIDAGAAGILVTHEPEWPHGQTALSSYATVASSIDRAVTH